VVFLFHAGLSVLTVERIMRLWLYLIIVIGLFGLSTTAQAASFPFLCPLFSDNMVLQRGQTDPVWGWTTPGAKITVQFAGKTATATAGLDGKWTALVGPLPAGGPYTMDISGPQTVHLSNVMIGDVWLCGGQSNMEFGIGMAKNAKDEIAAADHPNIRLFLVEHAWGATPQQEIRSPATWKVCSPDTIGQRGWQGFSAVAYFFGRKLQTDLNIPIGLIESCWGGTPAEVWTTEPTLAAMPDFATAHTQLARLANASTQIAQQCAAWCEKYDTTDIGYRKADFDDSHMQTIALPAQWVYSGPLQGFTGIVWFRKEIELPAGAAGHDAQLHLGPIAETDTVWVNGVQVGMGAGRDTPRNYTVPASALKAGQNSITVRVLNLYNWSGGFTGDAADMKLDTGDGESIPLAGDWHYHRTLAIQDAAERPVPDEASMAAQTPAALYNGMIAPLAPYGITGAIWYQGESNVGRAQQYEKLLPAMINDWRNTWGGGKFPFYIVQIANYGGPANESGQSGWAELREAQTIIAKTVPNSGISLTIDIGDNGNIHPTDKQDAGNRLALVALANHYHKKVLFAGPAYKSMKVEGDKVRISFTHTDGGLAAHGGPITGFQIAGADHKLVPADVQIDGDSVIVSAAGVTDPVAVHYGWSDGASCNLYNGAGLPAAPFRTDGW
jgi:sialate O-acetylesterase